MAYSRLRRSSDQRKALLRDLVTDLIDTNNTPALRVSFRGLGKNKNNISLFIEEFRNNLNPIAINITH